MKIKVSHQDFEAMIKPLEKRVYLYLKKICKEGFSAQDVMQETLITAYNKHQTVKDQTKFASWLYRIGINHCNMYKRKQKPIHDESEKVLLSIPDINSNPADIFDQQDFAQRLEIALHTLPEKYRVVLILKDIDGYKASEIADKTGLTVSNVKAISLRARKKLQQSLM